MCGTASGPRGPKSSTDAVLDPGTVLVLRGFLGVPLVVLLPVPCYEPDKKIPDPTRLGSTAWAFRHGAVYYGRCIPNLHDRFAQVASVQGESTAVCDQFWPVSQDANTPKIFFSQLPGLACPHGLAIVLLRSFPKCFMRSPTFLRV